MATTIVTAGEGGATRAVQEAVAMPLLMLVFFVFHGLIAWILVWLNFATWALAMLFGAAIGTIVWRRDAAEFLEAFIGSRNWFRGARGEFAVGRDLAHLPDEYIVFNDYRPIGPDGKPVQWNVDHVVVGP
jgi:hypothetical protein